jgi:hypothetical protein
MPTAFQVGMEMLFGDSNLGTDAIYIPAAGGGALVVRAISADPLAAIGGPGLLSATASRPTVHILRSEVPIKPRKGDLLDIGTEHFRVAEVTSDSLDLRWKLVLTNA